VKFGRKIPNRFGKIATKAEGDFLLTLYERRLTQFGNKIDLLVLL